jgi:hypothetical protein
MFRVSYKRIFLRINILLLIVFCFNLEAQNIEHLKTRYLFFGLNYMIPKYSQPLATRTFSVRQVPDISHVPLHMDALGIYKLKGKQILWGGVLHLTLDRFWNESNFLQIENYQPSFSVFYFIDNPPGKTGLFLRGDLGPVLMRVSSGDSGTENVNIGLGALLTTGLAISIRSRTYLLSANYSYKLIRSNSSQFLSFGFGLLI